MFEIHQFGLFVIATFILNVTPGNDFIYVASRSLSQGVRAGIISALGISAGLIIHIIASVLGLSVILAQSTFAFNLIKYIGAGYLMYIGIKLFFATSEKTVDIEAPQGKQSSSWIIFRQGFFTNVFNPKVAIFFLSFLPQFVTANTSYFSMQLLALGAWFIFSGTLVSISIALLFSKLRERLLAVPVFWKWQQKITGTILIALGFKIALIGRN